MADETKEATAPFKEFPGRLIQPLYFNAYYVIVQNWGTRVVLGESIYTDVPINYTSAAVIPTETAISMAKDILRLAIRQGITKLEDIDLTEGTGIVG